MNQSRVWPAPGTLLQSAGHWLDLGQHRVCYQLVDVQGVVVHPAFAEQPIVLHVAAAQAQAVVEVAADQLAFVHLRAVAQSGFEGLLRGPSTLVGQGDQHQQRHPGRDLLQVDDRPVTADHATALQLAYTLQAGARGEIDEAGKFLEGDAAVVAQDVDDRFVDAVEGVGVGVLGVHALGLRSEEGTGQVRR
ncbi:protein of unknown function [Pseudomonas sp. JV551A1]|nr:protein of unknown function [Pseudomonas sp. JV551A1]